jgi:hypothetical protein
MAYAYVYAPISGTVTGRDSYCSCPCGNCNGCGSAHGRCKNWASPIDIAGTGSIYLYVNYPSCSPCANMGGIQMLLPGDQQQLRALYHGRFVCV